jgi:hypothetical protein
VGVGDGDCPGTNAATPSTSVAIRMVCRNILAASL